MMFAIHFSEVQRTTYLTWTGPVSACFCAVPATARRLRNDIV